MFQSARWNHRHINLPNIVVSCYSLYMRSNITAAQFREYLSLPCVYDLFEYWQCVIKDPKSQQPYYHRHHDPLPVTLPVPSARLTPIEERSLISSYQPFLERHQL